MASFSPYMRGLIKDALAIKLKEAITDPDIIVTETKKPRSGEIGLELTIRAEDLTDGETKKIQAEKLAEELVQRALTYLDEEVLIDFGSTQDLKKKLRLREGKEKTVKFKKVAKGSAARSSSGKFLSDTSVINLVKSEALRIINNKMASGFGGGLKHDTRRLFNSIDIDGIRQENGMSFYFSYMYYPYQIFEPGVPTANPAMKQALASHARNPRKLITSSIWEAAKRKLGKGYSIRIMQAGGYAAPAGWRTKYEL